MELDKAIKERHSVRKFGVKKVKYEDIIEAIDAARLAPLAGNLSTVRFILVNDAKLIEKLKEASQQDFISTVNYVIVVCSDRTQLVRSYGERGEIYVRQQAGAAIENFILKLTDLGLATCWVGSFADDSVRDALDIPDSVNVEAIFPIGYEMGKGKQAKKTDLDNILYFNNWKQKKMIPLKKPEAL